LFSSLWIGENHGTVLECSLMYCGGNIIHLVIWNMVHGSAELMLINRCYMHSCSSANCKLVYY